MLSCVEHLDLDSLDIDRLAKFIPNIVHTVNLLLAPYLQLVTLLIEALN